MLNEKGFSLIEVVAALVLSSVILLSFFTFFTQSKKFERVNNEEYTTAQLSEELVHVLENAKYNPAKPNEVWNEYYNTNIPDTEEYAISVNNRVYYVNVEQKDSQEVTPLLARNFNVIKVTLSTDRDGVRKDVVTNYAYTKQ